VAEVFDEENGFLCVWAGCEDVAALDAGEHAAIDRRRVETAEIVAQQVDDHDIFAAVLGVVGEPVCKGVIFPSGMAAGRGSLQGACGDATDFGLVLHAEEELGREGEDEVVGLGVQEGAVGGGLTAAQTAIERGRTARRVDMDGHGEVELTDIAGADPRVNLGDALGVLLFCEGQDAIEWRVWTVGGAELGESWRVSVPEGTDSMVEDVGAPVNADPS
jgi:hypothetical protein